MQKWDIGTERRQVSRVIRVGAAIYCLIPAKIRDDAALHVGDRVVMETDGQMIYMAKIPMDELLARKLRPNGGNVRVQVRPDDYVKGKK